MLSARKLVAVVLTCALLFGGGAAAFASGSTDDVTRIGSQQITISDATMTVSDTTISGAGLPDATIEERTVHIEKSTTTIRGLQLSIDGQTYEFGRMTVTVEDVGVKLENVTFSGK